jgi:hypothetical protein
VSQTSGTRGADPRDGLGGADQGGTPGGADRWGQAGLTEDELDRLADYTADALDRGDTDEVARLVADDPRWAAAHAALVAADVAIRADLRDAGQPALVMPADVVARVDEAIATIARPQVVVPLARARRSTQRRRFLTTVVGAVAAAAVVVVGFGVASQIDRGGLTVTTNGAGLANGPKEDAGSAPSPVPPAVASLSQALVLATGTDYTAATLTMFASSVAPGYVAQSDAQPNPPQDSSTGVAGITTVPQAVRAAAPSPLARLTDPLALAECLKVIGGQYRGVVTAIDYAQYAGTPALVVVLRAANASTVLAVGKDCGLSGLDQKAAIDAP